MSACGSWRTVDVGMRRCDPVSACVEDERFVLSRLEPFHLADHDVVVAGFDLPGVAADEGSEHAREHRHSAWSLTELDARKLVFGGCCELTGKVVLMRAQHVDREVR